MKFKSITSRIVVSVIPIIAVSTLLFALITYIVTYRQTEALINEKITESVRLSRLSIQLELARNANITRSMALFAENANETMLASDRFTTYVRQSIESNENTVGGGIWFEPYKPFPDSYFFSAYAYQSGQETLVTRDYSDEVDYRTEIWYLDGKRSEGEIIWSDIYFDPIAQVAMITSTQPFFDEAGNMLGVTTADMALTQIEAIAGRISIGNTGAAFIVGRNGEFITFLDDSRGIANRIQEDDDPDLRALGQEIMAEDSGVAHLSWGGTAKIAYYDTLDEANWKLVVLTDETEAQYSTLNVLYIMIVPILGMALAVFSILRIARRLRDIVGKVNTFADRAASGELSQRIEILEYDEFGVMEDRLNRMILSMGDMSRRTEEMLRMAEAASQAKSEFLSRMSHEMRTPMNAILGMTQIAIQSDDLTKIHECLDKTEHASKHLLSLINDVLDLSAIEAGSLALHLEEFDLRATLDSICTMAEISAQEKDLIFNADIDPDLPGHVIGDALRFSQIAMNLLGNAVKFTPSGGQVSLAIQKGDETEDALCLVTSVSDTGIGISEENIGRLFQSFEQIDGGSARKFGGSGLGLSISRKLASLMGGTITIASIPGHGATFTFTAWVQKRPALLHADSPAAADETPPDLTGKTLLLAEDLEINREIVAVLLEATHADIVAAENGREAVDAFAKSPERFDLILMDIQMPLMDGLEATRMIRALDAGQTVPIIALTANAFASDIEKALNAGMNDHLAKPIEVRILYQKILTYLH